MFQVNCNKNCGEFIWTKCLISNNLNLTQCRTFSVRCEWMSAVRVRELDVLAGHVLPESVVCLAIGVPERVTRVGNLLVILYRIALNFAFSRADCKKSRVNFAMFLTITIIFWIRKHTNPTTVSYNILDRNDEPEVAFYCRNSKQNLTANVKYCLKNKLA